MHERLEAIVHGRVQMVMFRDFVQRKASGLGLTGQVENLRDGTVRLVAEGPKHKLESLMQKLWNGSLLSRVDEIEADWCRATDEYKNFTINYGR